MMEMPPPLYARRMMPRRTNRCVRLVVATVVVAVALWTCPTSSGVASHSFSPSMSSSNSGSRSDGFANVAQNDSSSSWSTTQPKRGELVNSTGSFATAEMEATETSNDTITFESLFLPEHGAGATPKVKVISNSNVTTSPPNTTEVSVVDVERIPIEKTSNAQNSNRPEPHLSKIQEASSMTPVSPTHQLNATGTPPSSSNKTEFVTLTIASSSSSSSSNDTVGVVGTETPPVVEVHGVPSPPTLVTASASDGHAEVSWQTPDDDGSDPILEYEVAWIDEVESKVAGTKIVALIPGSVVIIETNSSDNSSAGQERVPTTTIIPSLINGRSYTFKVRAKNRNGYSTWSAKSLAVSPLHPPDLCGRVTCSGHGTCFPSYQQNPSVDRNLAAAVASADGQCICRPGFNPPDCSVKNEETKFVWTVSEWGQCTSGCGGGQHTREAICWDVALDQKAASDLSCPDKKPSLTRICNGMECGSKLVSVRYVVETSYDEVLFSPESWEAFELAFTTEVAAALQIPRTRLEITDIKRGSIVVFFQILPASRVGEQSLNDIVELLQVELGNASSTLRSRGTFARRVETKGAKLSFSLADQTVAGGAEDISVAGLIGTVLVLCAFVALFGWFLRKRHERITGHLPREKETPRNNVINASQSDMKRMGIRTMA